MNASKAAGESAPPARKPPSPVQGPPRRLIRRAERAKKEHQPTDDGTLVFGVVEGDEAMLRATHARLVGPLAVPANLAVLAPDPKGKLRLEVAPWVLEELAPRLDVPAFLIEVYPTADQMEVERTPLAA